MKLIIAEKPSVGMTIADVVSATTKKDGYIEGNGYIVSWCFGHLVELMNPDYYIKKDDTEENVRWNIDDLPIIPDVWQFTLADDKGVRKQFNTLKKLMLSEKVKTIICATDAGREGECIFRYVYDYAKCNKYVERLWVSSLEESAIREGLNCMKPDTEYDLLFESGFARAKADWLIGMNMTRVYSLKFNALKPVLSIGRVQTPTLALVRAQEKQIEGFRPQTYYVINLEVGDSKAKRQQSNPYQLKDRSEAEALVQKMSQQNGRVASIEEKIKTEAAPLPYDLTEIQREANQRYDFSAKKTLSLVQSLYETHKIVTYPRTDSKYLTSDMKATMKERLQAVADFAPEVKSYLKNGGQVQQQAVFNDKKVTDHHALLPTEQRARYEKLSNDEQRIYQMIVERFLMLFAKPHKKQQQKVTVKFGNEVFVFTHNTVIEAGWKKSKEEATTVSWQEQMSVKPTFSIQKELTTPPKPLNEGTLLGKMEKHSLGTPATRAEIIEKLIKSELMERTPSGLQVSPKGKQLLVLVNPSLVTPELTEKWEKELELIAKGKYSEQKFLAQIEKDTKQLVKEIKQSESKYQDFSLTQKRCPECGEPLREKSTRDGKIYVCSSQTCKYRRRKDPKVSNRRCPQCHRKMEIIEGKNGAFFRCKFDGITEKMADKKERNKKLTKHEERRLMQKINQEEPQESPLAAALKAAMEKKE